MIKHHVLGELRVMEVKKRLMVPKTHYLKQVNREEHDFWDNLRNHCLLPQSTAFGLEDDLKGILRIFLSVIKGHF